MPAPLVWTEAGDDAIRRLRAAGATWDEISAQLGVSRWAAISRGRRIGVTALEVPPAEPADDPAREPLPAGHGITWGTLIAGTLLEGLAYPWPPLPVCPAGKT